MRIQTSGPRLFPPFPQNPAPATKATRVFPGSRGGSVSELTSSRSLGLT